MTTHRRPGDRRAWGRTRAGQLRDDLLGGQDLDRDPPGA